MNAITCRGIFDGRDKHLTASKVTFPQKHPAGEAYERYILQQRNGNNGNIAVDNINGATDNTVNNLCASDILILGCNL